MESRCELDAARSVETTPSLATKSKCTTSPNLILMRLRKHRNPEFPAENDGPESHPTVVILQRCG
jgi:hypothetical protein